mgnify:CR=1 FL=1
MALSDEVSKRCGAINETTLNHFVAKWKQTAVASELELTMCRNQTEAAMKDESMKRIHEKLEALIERQRTSHVMLEHVVKEGQIKDQKLAEAIEKLARAESEIKEMKTQVGEEMTTTEDSETKSSQNI